MKDPFVAATFLESPPPVRTHFGGNPPSGGTVVTHDAIPRTVARERDTIPRDEDTESEATVLISSSSSLEEPVWKQMEGRCWNTGF